MTDATLFVTLLAILALAHNAARPVLARTRGALSHGWRLRGRDPAAWALEFERSALRAHAGVRAAPYETPSDLRAIWWFAGLIAAVRCLPEPVAAQAGEIVRARGRATPEMVNEILAFFVRPARRTTAYR